MLNGGLEVGGISLCKLAVLEQKVLPILKTVVNFCNYRELSENYVGDLDKASGLMKHDVIEIGKS